MRTASYRSNSLHAHLRSESSCVIGTKNVRPRVKSVNQRRIDFLHHTRASLETELEEGTTSKSAEWFPGKDVTQLYPSMRGKVVLITGGGGSLGKETCYQLAKLGARVYVSDVNTDMVDRAMHFAETLNREAEPAGIDIVACPILDMSSKASIEEFVAWFATQEDHLDVLINNAVANYLEREPFFTPESLAGRPHVIFYGPYLLTRLLEGMLTARGGSRVVNVASVLHRFGKPVRPEQLLRDWDIGEYTNCKLALVMFTRQLQEKWRKKGVITIAIDPGAVYTGIWDDVPGLNKPPGSTISKAIFSPPEDGIAVYLHAIASPDLTPGGYYARGLFAHPFMTRYNSFLYFIFATVFDWAVRRWTGGRLGAGVKCVPVSQEALDVELAEDTWQYCAQLSGLED